jgi:hypothetical protein
MDLGSASAFLPDLDLTNADPKKCGFGISIDFSNQRLYHKI